MNVCSASALRFYPSCHIYESDLAHEFQLNKKMLASWLRIRFLSMDSTCADCKKMRARRKTGPELSHKC